MKDHALERARPLGSRLMKQPLLAHRCACCGAIVAGGGGYLTQERVAGEVGEVVTCLSHYCRSKAPVLAQVEAFNAAMTRDVMRAMTTLDRIPYEGT